MLEVQSRSKWLPIYDDFIYINDTIEEQSSCMNPKDLAQILITMARLQAFIFAVPANQARIIPSSSLYRKELAEQMEFLAGWWTDLDFHLTT